MTVASPRTSDSRTAALRRLRTYLAIAGSSAIGIVAVYGVFVRTAWGQRFDDVAYDGRSVESPAATAAMDDFLHSTTSITLVLLTAAIAAVALARHRPRLAVAVVAAILASSGSAEVLKRFVFTRPALDQVAGIAENSYPSGHATIGMAISLGIVMVASTGTRWAATASAVIVSTAYGVGVLATGWHRPSDVVGAYLVCVTCFALAIAGLLWWDRHRPPRRPHDRRGQPPSSQLLALSASLAAAAAIAVVIVSIRSDGLRTVEFAGTYVLVCIFLIALAAVIVVVHARLLQAVERDELV